MKQLLFLLCITLSIQVFAQSPPRIRVPGSSPEEQMAKRQGFFKAGTSFTKGQRYYSEDNRYCFIWQEDGNLVVYKMNGKKFNAVWNAGTAGKATKTCVFQRDGNLVLYDFTNKPIWNAFTDNLNKARAKGNKGDLFFPSGSKPYMVMQNDGNLVIYAVSYPGTGSTRWASDSYEKNN
ncbi:MAG: hypothetical protein EOO09_04980 [Chitinophagaceae bacterium]|nr:MAG: hypothetical protein EOO09_04980 [Chitinophagaceae bacterium]